MVKCISIRCGILFSHIYSFFEDVKQYQLVHAHDHSDPPQIDSHQYFLLVFWNFLDCEYNMNFIFFNSLFSIDTQNMIRKFWKQCYYINTHFANLQNQNNNISIKKYTWQYVTYIIVKYCLSVFYKIYIN